MAEREILKVRFVSFGEQVAFEITLTAVNLPLWLEVESNPYLSKNHLNYYRQQTNVWIETLNSGDAPVPRIESRDDNTCVLYREGSPDGLRFYQAYLTAFNQIYGKEAEIYEPKTIKADWKQIFPRKIKPYEICFDKTVACDDCVRRADRITELLQTESGGLEVHELIVYEV